MADRVHVGPQRPIVVCCKCAKLQVNRAACVRCGHVYGRYA